MQGCGFLIMSLAKENPNRLNCPGIIIFKNIVTAGPFRTTESILSISHHETGVQIFLWNPLISLRHKQNISEPRAARGPLIVISVKHATARI